MRIGVVINSEQQKSLAGTRIRYQRIAPYLLAKGHSLDILVIDEVTPQKISDFDIYLFSKCQDSRSIILAKEIKSRGLAVGIDGFDDYFSQINDSRMAAQRTWMKAIAPDCDYFLCSTKRMASILSQYMPHAVGHVLNDPAPRLGAQAASVDARVDEARATRCIKTVWFGVGDNPQFEVGLRDLTAQAEHLDGLAQSGFKVQLTVLTNRRALSTKGLAGLRRMALDFSVEEWSLEAEARHLAQAQLAFLPVNAQAFSIAKSLNRAITALTAGVQVFSPNYDLYSPLAPFIYQSATDLALDLANGRMRLNSGNASNLDQLLGGFGEPLVEAINLSEFLETLPPHAQASCVRPAAGVLSGVRSSPIVSRFAQDRGLITVGGVFSAGRSDDDIIFIGGKDENRIRLSARAVQRLAPEFRPVINESANSLVTGAVELSLGAMPHAEQLTSRTLPATPGVRALADYASLVSDVRSFLLRLLNIELTLSEADSTYLQGVP